MSASDFRFNCAGIEAAVTIVGRLSDVVGEYAHYPSGGGKPDLSIHIDTKPYINTEGIFEPQFEFEATNNVLTLERQDVSGSFTFEHNGSISGVFHTSERPSGLEAIIRIGMSLLLPHKNALLLHSSSVVDDNRAFVFSGVSGAGKSTISDLLSDGCAATKLADELVILQKLSDRWMVVVAPFAGSRGLPHGSSAPLDSINFLAQAPTHKREAISALSAMTELPRHIVNFSRSKATLEKVLTLTIQLVQQTNCFHLEFAKAASVCDVLGITCTKEGV